MVVPSKFYINFEIKQVCPWNWFNISCNFNFVCCLLSPYYVFLNSSLDLLQSICFYVSLTIKFIKCGKNYVWQEIVSRAKGCENVTEHLKKVGLPRILRKTEKVWTIDNFHKHLLFSSIIDQHQDYLVDCFYFIAKWCASRFL